MPHRHKIPAVIEPSDDVSVCVPLPNHPDYIAAFLFTLKQMTLDRYWQHTEDLAALTVRQVMLDRTLKPVLDQLAAGIWCGDSDDCIEYPPNNDEIISYSPQDPFTQPGHAPSGYLFPPFTRFADIVPDFIPDWFANLIVGFAEGLTGYDANDVLVTIGSIPLTVDFDDLLTDGLPKITVNVSGKGRLLLHLLNVPFGGRALISVDVEFNPIDIINGLFTDGFRLVELERDYSSIPPELDVDHIEEIELDEEGEHTIYITFLPVLDDSLIPLLYGGGFRKVEWCGKDVTDVNIDCDYIQDCFDVNPDNLALQNITVVTMEQTTQEFLDELEQSYDGTNPNSINASIPTDAPDDLQEFEALCYAIETWLNQYAQAKMSKLRAKNGLSQFWADVQAGIVAAYGGLNNVLGFILPDDIFGCFVSDNDAISALSDSAALDEVKCELYNELSEIALLETSLEGAINAAVGSLAGTAQDIACVLDNDYTEAHALNFYFIYGRALDNGLASDCSACIPDYCREYDFRIDQKGFSDTYPSRPYATYLASQGWGCEQSNISGTNDNRVYILRDFGQMHNANEFVIEYVGNAGGSGRNVFMSLYDNAGNMLNFHSFGAYAADQVENNFQRQGAFNFARVGMGAVTDTGAASNQTAFIFKELRIRGDDENQAPTGDVC